MKVKAGLVSMERGEGWLVLFMRSRTRDRLNDPRFRTGVGWRDERPGEGVVLFSLSPPLFPRERHTPARTATKHIKGESSLENGCAALLAAQNARFGSRFFLPV